MGGKPLCGRKKAKNVFLKAVCLRSHRFLFVEGKARPAGAGKRLFRVSGTGTLRDSIKNAQAGEPYAVCLPAFGLAAPVLPVLRR